MLLTRNATELSPTCAGVMSALPPGVSAVLFELYELGVIHSTISSTHSLFISSLLQASCVSSLMLFGVPRVGGRGLLVHPQRRLVQFLGLCTLSSFGNCNPVLKLWHGSMSSKAV
jgi:hypothetical protein